MEEVSIIEKVLCEHREIFDFLEVRADQAARGEKGCSITVRSRISYELEEHKDYLQSEAQSDLDMQESRVASADRALRESGMQLEGWNFTKRINCLIILREKRAGYALN